MARLFIAVDLSVAVVERLTVLRRSFQEAIGENGSVRWVKPANVHVTLKFLDDVDEALIPMLGETLTSLVGPLFPFEVTCCRLGAFPSIEEPRIIWAGLDDNGAEVMGLLRQSIERDLEQLGFAPDGREYRPHLTLGRVRSADPAIGDLLADFADLDFGSSYIKDIVLFESKLGPDGPSYVVRRRFPLGEV